MRGYLYLLLVDVLQCNCVVLWTVSSSDIAGRIDPRLSFCRLTLCFCCHCHTLLPFTCADDFLSLSGHRHLLGNVIRITVDFDCASYSWRFSLALHAGAVHALNFASSSFFWVRTLISSLFPFAIYSLFAEWGLLKASSLFPYDAPSFCWMRIVFTDLTLCLAVDGIVSVELSCSLSFSCVKHIWHRFLGCPVLLCGASHALFLYLSSSSVVDSRSATSFSISQARLLSTRDLQHLTWRLRWSSMCDSKGCVAILLVTGSIQIRSFTNLLFALIVLLRECSSWRSSSSWTCISSTFMNFSEWAFIRVSFPKRQHRRSNPKSLIGFPSPTLSLRRFDSAKTTVTSTTLSVCWFFWILMYSVSWLIFSWVIFSRLMVFVSLRDLSWWSGTSLLRLVHGVLTTLRRSPVRELAHLVFEDGTFCLRPVCVVLSLNVFVEVTSGHPRSSLFGQRCTVGVLGRIHRCVTEVRVTLWQSVNPSWCGCWKAWSRDIVCFLRSRSTCVEGCVNNWL